MTDPALIDLFVARTPLVDVRAPVEFGHGTLPGAVSLPLLNDDERARVGLTYKTEGQEAAIRLGLSIVSGETKERRLDAWAEFFRTHPESVFFCFRGGLRSNSVREALAKERGVRVPLIEGGYKRGRGLLLAQLTEIAHAENFAVLSGFTGTGKTRLLQNVSPFRRVCDLERLARHRGSAFGGGLTQPSQIDLENSIALCLIELRRDPRCSPILLEDESRAIGIRTVPMEIFARLSTSPIYVVEAGVETRARELVTSYALEDFGLRGGERDETKIEALRVGVQRNLVAIERRLGGAERQALAAMVDEACAENARTGDLDAHLGWVARLLERYYDKLYRSHLEREKDRIVFRGSFGEVEARLREIPDS